jgi:hypothetical protein
MTPTPYWNELLTGCYVKETIGQRRAGVIVFDVQEHGRIHKFFRGHEYLNDWFKEQGLPALATREDCYAVCTQFGIDAAKTSNPRVLDAMKTYFNPYALWSLCDMAYKYVVRTADDKYFMQDSFALEKDITKTTTTSTFERCPFCPVCFDDVQDPEQQSLMFYHIKDNHKDFPYANIAPAAGRPGSPHMEELMASDSSNPSSSQHHSDSSDEAASDRSFDPENAANDKQRHDEFAGLMHRSTYKKSPLHPTHRPWWQPGLTTS